MMSFPLIAGLTLGLCVLAGANSCTSKVENDYDLTPNSALMPKGMRFDYTLNEKYFICTPDFVRVAQSYGSSSTYVDITGDTANSFRIGWVDDPIDFYAFTIFFGGGDFSIEIFDFGENTIATFSDAECFFLPILSLDQTFHIHDEDNGASVALFYELLLSNAYIGNTLQYKSFPSAGLYRVDFDWLVNYWLVDDDDLYNRDFTIGGDFVINGVDCNYFAFDSSSGFLNFYTYPYQYPIYTENMGGIAYIDLLVRSVNSNLSSFNDYFRRSSYYLYEASNYGFDNGYSAGVNAGDPFIWQDGYNAGRQQADQEAYQNGYDVGFSQGEQSGAELGYTQGEEVGYDEGYDIGYDDGYRIGQREANNATSSILTLFGSIASVPITILNGLGGFTIWDVSIISIALTFLFIGLILWVIRRFI